MASKRELLSHLLSVVKTMNRIASERDAMAKACLVTLQEAFRKSGLTQAELVAISGCSQANISRWMTGKTQPSAATIDALCRAIETAAKMRQETDR